nr:VOC family protein [Candidatus Microthrix sp.]
MSTDAATPIQIVIDATDLLAQARFWAEALHYEVENTTDLINRVIEAGLATRDIIHEDDGRLYWNDLVGVGDPGGTGPRLLFQRNPAPRPTRTGCTSTKRRRRAPRDDEVERLRQLGAEVLYEIDEPGVIT